MGKIALQWNYIQTRCEFSTSQENSLQPLTRALHPGDAGMATRTMDGAMAKQLTTSICLLFQTGVWD